MAAEHAHLQAPLCKLRGIVGVRRALDAGSGCISRTEISIRAPNVDALPLAEQLVGYKLVEDTIVGSSLKIHRPFFLVRVQHGAVWVADPKLLLSLLFLHRAAFESFLCRMSSMPFTP